MHVKLRFLLLGFFFLSLFAMPISAVGPCFNDCFSISDSCACPGGCFPPQTGICYDHIGTQDCSVQNGWFCSSTYYTPEFAPIPGFLTFLGSLALPYWLYRKRKK